MNELDIVVAWIVCGAVTICGLCTNNIEAVVTLVLPIIMYMICVRQKGQLDVKILQTNH